MKCPNCESELSRGGSCSECGWVGTTPSSDRVEWAELSPSHLIADRFLVTQAADIALGHAVRVYLAEDQRGNRAIKVKEALSETPAAQGLKGEYDILSAFSHPAIPEALALAEVEGSTFLMIQSLHGAPLAEACTGKSVTDEQHLDWLIQLCDALHKLHAQNVVHLAVHPQKLLITEDRKLVLEDFSRAHRLPIGTDDRLVGLEYYSAPEVFLAPEDITIRADIYALGATWYSLLLGRPLSSEQFEEMFFAKPPVEFRPDILPAINRIIAKAMQRLPERRHKSIPYVRDALEEVREQLRREWSRAVGVYSDTGLNRDANEDSYLVEEFHLGEEGLAMPCGFYLVSDGMGGEAGGTIASRMTSETIADTVSPELRKYRLQDTGRDLSAKIQPLLQEGINSACTAVHNQAREDPLLRRMGATVVVALVLGPNLYVANVGDSRAYLIKRAGINPLTRDHTVVRELIDQGDLDEEKARDHPAQGELTRNIGSKPETDAYFCHLKLNRGDSVLLCSDGLTDVVDDEEIQRIVLETDSRQEACEQLVNLANSRGGPDNITVILTGYEGGEG